MALICLCVYRIRTNSKGPLSACFCARRGACHDQKLVLFKRRTKTHTLQLRLKLDYVGGNTTGYKNTPADFEGVNAEKADSAIKRVSFQQNPLKSCNCCKRTFFPQKPCDHGKGSKSPFEWWNIKAGGQIFCVATRCSNCRFWRWLIDAPDYFVVCRNRAQLICWAHDPPAICATINLIHFSCFDGSKTRSLSALGRCLMISARPGNDLVRTHSIKHPLVCSNGQWSGAIFWKKAKKLYAA